MARCRMPSSFCFILDDVTVWLESGRWDDDLLSSPLSCARRLCCFQVHITRLSPTVPVSPYLASAGCWY